MLTTQISTDSVLPDRLFTHPAYTAIDYRQINYMLMRLSQIVMSISQDENPNLFAPESHELFESDGRHHRIIPIRPQLLKDAAELTIVGFFGQRNLCSDGMGVASRDKMLFTEMRNHPGLYSYSSLELTNGDYGNCVIFKDEHAKNSWGFSPVHAEAVGVLSPLYYRSVRLYNGIVKGSIFDFYRMRLNVAKYYDYSEQPVWSGYREL
ncbi:MAG: hypothetical protein ACI9EW_000224 [Cellvibrionaceae bacterium]|jgi:hypothetical protein